MADSAAPVEVRNPLVAIQATTVPIADSGADYEAAASASTGSSELSPSSSSSSSWRVGHLSRRRLIGLLVGGALIVCAAAAALAVFLVYYSPNRLVGLAVPQKLYVRFSAVARNDNASSVVGNVFIPDAWAAQQTGHVQDAYATSAYVGSTYFTFDDSAPIIKPLGKRVLSPLATKKFVGAAAANAAVNDAYTVPMSDQAPNATVLTFVDGSAFFAAFSADSVDTSVGCVDDRSVPPLGDLVNALQAVTQVPVSDVDPSMLSEDCDLTQDLWIGRYMGSSYIVCHTADQGRYKVLGADFIADVAVNPAGETVPPPPAPPAGLTCPEVQFPTARRLREATTEEELLEQDAWWSVSAATQLAARRRLSSKKRCVFMHGMGPKTDESPASTYHGYWGDVHKNAKCSSYVFLRRNTIGRPWDDASLQRYFCSQAADGGGTISDTIVFTHSMGSLIVAGALQSGYCRMASSSKWFHVQGPLLGSKAADFASNLCQNAPSAIAGIAASMGFCVGRNAAPAVSSLRPSYNSRQKYAQLVNYVHANVDGAMCGTATMGLDKLQGLGLSALAGIVNYGQSSDGLVAWSSCSGNGVSGKFDDTYKYESVSRFGVRRHDLFIVRSSVFMDAGVHHLDGTCRNGDGWWGPDRMPCKWYGRVTA